MAMPALFTVLYCFKDSLANKAVIVLMLCTYLYLNTFYVKTGKKIKFLIFNLCTIFYISYIGFVCGLEEIINSFFYSYLLTFIMIWMCIEDELREDFICYFINGKKRFLCYITILFVAVVLSVFFLNGLRVGYGTKIPVLYGPFNIAHMLAYILLVVYCGISLFNLNNKKRTVVILKSICVICLIFTAVRSAVLGLAVLIVCDYLSIKTRSKKVLIFSAAFIALVFVATCTDLLINNPLIEKTLYASEIGGSITNGREWYRQIAMASYISDTNVIEKAFGVGISGVVDSIYRVLRVRIHAHNDYVNLLVGYGFVGFALFIVSQLSLSRACRSKYNVILLQLFIFILAYYNGFALYVNLTSCLLIVVAFFELKTIGNEKQKGKA